MLATIPKAEVKSDQRHTPRAEITGMWATIQMPNRTMIVTRYAIAWSSGPPTCHMMFTRKTGRESLCGLSRSELLADEVQRQLDVGGLDAGVATGARHERRLAGLALAEVLAEIDLEGELRPVHGGLDVRLHLIHFSTPWLRVCPNNETILPRVAWSGQRTPHPARLSLIKLFTHNARTLTSDRIELVTQKVTETFGSGTASSCSALLGFAALDAARMGEGLASQLAHLFDKIDSSIEVTVQDFNNSTSRVVGSRNVHALNALPDILCVGEIVVQPIHYFLCFPMEIEKCSEQVLCFPLLEEQLVLVLVAVHWTLGELGLVVVSTRSRPQAGFDTEQINQI